MVRINPSAGALYDEVGNWPKKSYHIKHFKLNILVRSCFYWLYLSFTTLTLQYGIL